MKTFLSIILLSYRISKKNGQEGIDKHCCPTPQEYDQQIMDFQYFGLNAEKNGKKKHFKKIFYKEKYSCKSLNGVTLIKNMKTLYYE